MKELRIAKRIAIIAVETMGALVCSLPSAANGTGTLFLGSETIVLELGRL